MLVGGFCAIAQGFAWPLLMIFFGKMVDTFIKAGENMYL